MQLHHPEARFREDGEYAVTMNPGNDHPFAAITLSEDGKTFFFAPEADVDRLLAAAARAKAMFEALRRPHAYAGRGGHCDECGVCRGLHPTYAAIASGQPAVLCQWHGGSGQSGPPCQACADEQEAPGEADGFAAAELDAEMREPKTEDAR